MRAETVRIHYRRPPDRIEIFEQDLVARTDAVVVTLMRRTPLPRPMRVGGRTVLEADSPVVWFTFPGLAHDIGRFHTAAGEFTGIYANILTPVVFRSETEWETTDLFLDVWIGVDSGPELLDEDELDTAVEAGWIDAAIAATARSEATGLMSSAAAGRWPPASVAEWPLDRALAAVRERTR